MQFDRRSFLALPAGAALASSSLSWAAHVRPRPAGEAPLGKAEAAEEMNRILTACLAHSTSGGAGLKLGETGALFDERAAGLEGVSRLLWAVVPALQGGLTVPGVDLLRRGIVNGTTPDGPHYWGALGRWGNQRAVEMAALALARHDAPAHFLTPLSATERANLFRWLEAITECDLPPNNWRWFRILTLETLAGAGHKVDRAVIEKDHALLDSMRLERGWRRDGVGGGVDYYNGLAFHFYGLLFARWKRREEPERARRLIEDARAFADDYRLWFTDEGEQLVYGRSLTYRYASLGFWGLLADVGHPRISAGQMRQLWSRAMRFWSEQPIWSEPGVPSIGYRYPNLLMQEFYNSPQSPLWMMKAFWPLALPASHPFWTARPEPFTTGRQEYMLPSAPQMLRHYGGDPCLIPGSMNEGELRSYEDKYGKFAYTARHGFSVESTRWLAQGYCGDNLLALSADGRIWHARSKIDQGALEKGTMITRWSTPDAQIETRQRFTSWGEERQHLIQCARPLRLVAAGHAVDRAQYGRSLDQIKGEPDGGAPVAIGPGLWSDIQSTGDLRRGVLPCAPNTNLNFPSAAVPVLVGRVEAGETRIVTRLAWGAGKSPQVSPATRGK